MDLTFADLVKACIGGLVVFVLTEIMKFARAGEPERQKTQNIVLIIGLLSMALFIGFCLYWWAFIKTGAVERWEILGAIGLLFWLYKIPDFIWYIRGNRGPIPPLLPINQKVDDQSTDDSKQ